MSQEYGLIGKKLSHSFSRRYFNEKFAREGVEATYDLFELPEIAAFPDLLKQHPRLRGLNVTIPYKSEVMEYLDILSPEAQAVGAVNTILVEPGRLTGYNTDIIGFRKSLMRVWGEKPLHHALVLGTGGAAKAVAYVLKQLHSRVTLVSRHPEGEEISYTDLEGFEPAGFDLVVNTTPLGMYPDVEAAPPFPYEKLSGRHLAFDLVYNPEETRFMQLSAARGAKVCNGLEMLILQAEAAWEIWSR